MGYGRTLIVDLKTAKIERKLLSAIGRAMAVVAKDIESEIRSTIQNPYPPASKPGNPPHRRSGYLSGSVNATGDEKGIRIREAQYGFFLEGGTFQMDPRPHVRPVLFTKANQPRKKWATRIAKLALDMTD